MKKLLSTLLLAAAVPATMLAKPMYMESLQNNRLKATPELKSTFLKADTKINPVILAERKGQNGKIDTIPTHGSLYNFYGTGFATLARTIQYDEYSNTVYILHNFFQLQSASVPESNGKLDLITYNQGGAVPGETINIYEKTKGFLFNTSFDIANPTKSTNPEDVNVLAIAGHNYDHSGADFVSEGAGFCLYNSAKNLKKTIVQKSPADEANYQWSSLNPFSFSNADGETFYIAGGPLFGTATGVPHGRYGFISFENTKYNDIEFSQFPPEFALSKFKAPEAKSHSNSPVYFGKDNNNKLYAFVVNKHTASTFTKQLPAITVSDDNGASWGDFDIMPREVLDEYLKPYLEGNPVDEIECLFSIFANGADFLMQENGDFSYAVRLQSWNPGAEVTYLSQIVEVYKENGNWGMRKIEDMTFDNEGKIASNAIWALSQGEAEPVVDKVVYDVYRGGNEIELAITKDKKYLVMKWLDYKFTRTAPDAKKVYQEGVESPELAVQYENSTTNQWTEEKLTYFQPTAVYVKYREIGKDTWSDAVQLTNDDRYILHSHIPDVLPSLEQIPMITTLGKPEISGDANYPISNIPNVYKDMISDIFRTPLYGVYNGTGVLSVDDTKTSKDAISVYPNPVAHDFTVSCEPNSTVEVFNTLGEKMMDVKGNTANTSSLANGIYLLKVTKNGKVTSTLFTVAK